MLKKFALVGALALVLAGCASGPDAGTLGFQALLAGDLPKAQSYLETAYKEAPSDPYVQLNLGAVYQGQGRVEDAIRLYKLAQESGKNSPVGSSNESGATAKTVGEIATSNLAALGVM